MDRYRISQVAERTGMPATTLRYYETRGLLPVRRSRSGYRTYDESDVEWLHFIATAKELGLSLDEIRDLVDVRDDGRCRDVRDTLGPAGAPREDLAGGGVRIRPPAGRVDDVAALVAAESRCCPLLTFHLTVAPGGITLDAHAPEGAAELLRELLAC